MDGDTLKRAFENAGLTRYEADAYVTLVDHGRLAAVDVAKKSTVPTSQVYDTLRSLEERGFVETIDQDRLHAEPCDPVDVMTYLRDRGNLLTDAAEELEDRWERPDLDDHRVGVVKQSETVMEHVRSQLHEASVAVELALTADQFEALATDLKAAAERGVIVHASVYDEAGLGERCSRWNLPDDGIEVRVVTIPGPFIAIVDRSRMYFTPNHRGAGSYGILINDDILSVIHNWFFQTCLWFPAEQLYAPRDSWRTFINIKEFMRVVTPLYWEEAEVVVTISGHDVATRDHLTVTGSVCGVWYPNSSFEAGPPSFEQLSTYSTIWVDTGDEVLSVGGWGAVYEDVETQKITLEAVRYRDESAQS